MKKWGFLLFLIVCLVFTFVYITPIFKDKDHVKIQQNGQTDNNISDDQRFSEGFQQIEIKKEQIYQGNLLLINSKYPIHQEGVKSDIVNLSKHNEWINGYGLLDTNIDLSKGIAQKFSEMVHDAEQKGVNHFLIDSGYRDFKKQNKLYKAKGASYALPAGYSEHNSGWALDVGSSLTKMAQAPEGKWLKENAWKYGFILRYPKDKANITGIKYEPWHIRYVGLPHSAIMKEKNFVLEEYLDYLKEKKKITAEFDGKKYTFSYHSFSENMTIHIPENQEYKISGDNMDGIIVTMYD